jgi:hypothetical protein
MCSVLYIFIHFLGASSRSICSAVHIIDQSLLVVHPVILTLKMLI